MSYRELKLKQASAVLGIRPKDLQNFVQAGVLRPRRVGALYYFDRKALVSAKIAVYLKDSLGASTRYLTKFTRAVSQVAGFATGQTETVRVHARARDEQPVSILIPLRGLVAQLDARMPRTSAGPAARSQASRLERGIAHCAQAGRGRPRVYVSDGNRQDAHVVSSRPQEAGADGCRRSGGSNRLDRTICIGSTFEGLRAPRASCKESSRGCRTADWVGRIVDDR
jgi:hypothetical protein